MAFYPVFKSVRFYFVFLNILLSHLSPQTLSYMLQTLLTGQYSMLPNNLSSPQVHLVMHQLNQCYTQLAWQQNNVQRWKYMRAHHFTFVKKFIFFFKLSIICHTLSSDSSRFWMTSFASSSNSSISRIQRRQQQVGRRRSRAHPRNPAPVPQPLLVSTFLSPLPCILQPTTCPLLLYPHSLPVWHDIYYLFSLDLWILSCSLGTLFQLE